MASKDKAEPTPSVTRTGGTTRLPDGAVRVWGEVGVTLPLPDMPIGVLRFSFGHERLARGSSTAEIAKAEAMIHEFNEVTLDKRVKKYLRQFRQIAVDVAAGDDEGSERRSGSKGSAIDRANKRRGKKKGKK